MIDKIINWCACNVETSVPVCKADVPLQQEIVVENITLPCEMKITVRASGEVPSDVEWNKITVTTTLKTIVINYKHICKVFSVPDDFDINTVKASYSDRTIVITVQSRLKQINITGLHDVEVLSQMQKTSVPPSTDNETTLIRPVSVPTATVMVPSTSQVTSVANSVTNKVHI